MAIEYRHAQPDEYAAAVDTISAAFGERPDIARVAEATRRTWEPGRLVAAFEGDRVVGSFRTWGTELTVPGGAHLPGAAVTGVAVRPTHRRRGILSGMAGMAHRDVVERGEAVALLYASEYPIYGRFGYGPATRWASWSVDARSAQFRDAAPGGVEIVTPGQDTLTMVREVFERVRRARPGEIARRDVAWPLRLGLEEEPWGETWKGFLVIRRDARGEPDGYARYTGKASWEHNVPQTRVEVQELVAASGHAYRALWHFLLELDLVATVTSDALRVDERLPWLLVNARAARVTDIGDAIWVRLFDVPRALEARAYERTGRLVLEVVDDQVDGGRRRLLLDATPDGARCSATDRAPDLSLPVAALGAAYLGGTRLRDVVRATGHEEHRTGALAEADALLRTADAPFCSTFF